MISMVMDSPMSWSLEGLPALHYMRYNLSRDGIFFSISNENELVGETRMNFKDLGPVWSRLDSHFEIVQNVDPKIGHLVCLKK